MIKHHFKNTGVLVALGVLVIAVVIIIVNRSEGVVKVDPIVTATTTTNVVNLAFEKTGKVVAVKYTVGERVASGTVIMQISSADVRASLAEAQAAVKLEEAKLASLVASTQPKNIANLRADVEKAQARYTQTELTFFTTLQNAYSLADDAVHSKVDTFFTNPRSNHPELTLDGNATTKASIESGRVEVENRLNALNILMKTATTSETSAISFRMKQDLGEIRLFLDNISFAVNASTTASWKTLLSDARTEIHTAITNIFTIEDALKTADTVRTASIRELDRIQSGGITREVNVEQATLAEAQARVATALAELEKTSLKSPVDGVITKQSIKIGEIATASTPVVSVMSDR